MQPISDGAKNYGGMTADDVKNRLREYRRACRRCEETQRRIDAHRANMAGNRYMSTDALDDTLGQIAELERRLHAEEAARDAALEDVKTMIGMAEDKTGKTILQMRYIDGVRFETIPDKLFLCDRTMWRHYNRVIREIVAAGEKLTADG